MTENILNRAVEEEITQSYIDYSMSVIISRALPDVRDWFKPVQRRILYSMYDLKIFHNSSFRKSAAVIWEVLWKYHPHGDSSVYEALVRMAQSFSLRYPLIDWQWNFGNIDGDWAAAMRYTECRLTKIAEEMLGDIDQETVEWRDNYDNSRKEPIYLPTKFPNHLCNGTMGIAVGMATNMAPHNLTEIIEALLFLIDNPNAEIEEIMQYIKGPDFPTGGIIYDPENIKEVYKKWKWSIAIRWKIRKEQTQKWNERIIIYELPYQLNKSTFISKIWELINTKRIEWITDITDESNKEKIKVSITVSKSTDADTILTKLYKLTDLQTNFNLNNITLTENAIQPKLLNIKDLLQEFINFRRQIVYNRSLYQLNKAKDRLHILEGLKAAIDILDEVIATIKWSETRSEAKEKLMNNFWFTDPQADYILMLRLQTLVWLEIQKISKEIEEKKQLIEYLSEIVENSEKLDKVIIDELIYIKDEYWDERKTEISDETNIYNLDKSIKDIRKLEELQKENIILRTGLDYSIKVLYQSRINTVPTNTYDITYTHNQKRIIVITDRGEILKERIKDLWSFNIKWKSLNFKKEYNLKGNIIFLSLLEDFDSIVMLTNNNNIKKVKKELIDSFKKTPTKIMGLWKDEKIIKVLKVKEEDTIGTLSTKWTLLLYKESDIRASGKTAGWVKAMTLEENEKISDMIKNVWELFVLIYSQYWAKFINMEDLKKQKRWQKGLQIAKLKAWEEIVWGISVEDGLLHIQTQKGKIQEIDSKNIKLKNRNTKLDNITDSEIKNIYIPRTK